MDDFELAERPKTRVQWLLGNRCNYQCSYCNEMFRKGNLNFPTDEVVLEICQDIIAHYDDLGRDVVFEFIGGEPTLVDKIPYISERLHNHPASIVLKTNGSASLDWWRAARKYIGSVIITVHREFCDLNHIYNVIDLLKNDKNHYDLDVQVLVAVTNARESWDWGVKTLKSIREKFDLGNLQMLYSDFGMGSKMYMPYTPEQWIEYKELGGSQPIPNLDPPGVKNTEVANDENLQPIKLFRPTNSFKGYTCYAGIDTLVIDYQGNVSRGWCFEGGIIGNINNLPISWPTTTIVCNKELCGNGFDQQALKEKV
jgi:MoaA/NifB/PqqE/SkfB family radical SAM enzyme